MLRIRHACHKSTVTFWPRLGAKCLSHAGHSRGEHGDQLAGSQHGLEFYRQLPCLGDFLVELRHPEASLSYTAGMCVRKHPEQHQLYTLRPVASRYMQTELQRGPCHLTAAVFASVPSTVCSTGSTCETCSPGEWQRRTTQAICMRHAHGSCAACMGAPPWLLPLPSAWAWVLAAAGRLILLAARG